MRVYGSTQAVPKRQENVCTCGYKVVGELEVSSCIVVIEQRDTSKSGVYIVMEALAAVVQADIVELTHLMPWICTPRRSCMRMLAILLYSIAHRIRVC